MGARGKSKYSKVFQEGQRFGKWTVVSSEIVIDHEAKINCRCDCGTITLVSCYTILNETSTACKICSHKKTGRDRHSWKGVGDIPASRFKRIANPLERQALAETWNMSGGVCALTGWPISLNDRTASPDRIDPTKGYTTDNIQWVHKHVNISKNVFDMEHFISLCHAVVRQHSYDPQKKHSDNVFGHKLGSTDLSKDQNYD